MRNVLLLVGFVALILASSVNTCESVEHNSDTTQAHILIIADGRRIPTERVQQLAQGRFVIVLDGAANSIVEQGLYPDVILGDLDSVANRDYWGIKPITPFQEPYPGNHGVLIVPRWDQNYTDLEKGILYADSLGAQSIVVTNATGERMDHSIGNIRFLRKYHRDDRELMILTESQRLQYFKDAQATIEGHIGAHCAIMAFPKACVTSHGLQWEMDNYSLEFAFSESMCNLLAAPKAVIEVTGEVLVISTPDCDLISLHSLVERD